MWLTSIAPVASTVRRQPIRQCRPPRYLGNPIPARPRWPRLAPISHTTLAQSPADCIGCFFRCTDAVAQGVARRRCAWDFLWLRWQRDDGVLVGLGMMPRLLRAAAARVRRASRAR